MGHLPTGKLVNRTLAETGRGPHRLVVPVLGTPAEGRGKGRNCMTSPWSSVRRSKGNDADLRGQHTDHRQGCGADTSGRYAHSVGPEGSRDNVWAGPDHFVSGVFACLSEICSISTI